MLRRQPVVGPRQLFPSFHLISFHFFHSRCFSLEFPARGRPSTPSQKAPGAWGRETRCVRVFRERLGRAPHHPLGLRNAAGEKCFVSDFLEALFPLRRGRKRREKHFRPFFRGRATDKSSASFIREQPVATHARVFFPCFHSVPSFRLFVQIFVKIFAANFLLVSRAKKFEFLTATGSRPTHRSVGSVVRFELSS